MSNPVSSNNPITGNEDVPAAIVVQSNIGFDSTFLGTINDNNGAYIEPVGGTIFTDYVIKNQYERDGHIYMMPVASPGGFNGNSVAFCQLASPTLLWICDWTASKKLTQPEIPDPEINSPDWILLDILPETMQVAVGADGVSPQYRISATYVYGHTNPSANVFNDICYPRPPWLEDLFSRTMPASKLLPNLITTTGQQAGGSSAGQPGPLQGFVAASPGTP